jgi:hypothetical protein
LSAFEYVLLAWGSANALVLLVALLFSSLRLRRRALRRRRRSGTMSPHTPARDACASGQDAWS